MELKPGYKQTEVGVIPEDWDCVHIGDVAETSSGATPSRAKQQEYFDGGTIPWVKTLDLNNSSILETDECVTPSALQQTSLRLYPRGAVLVAMYGGFNQIGRTGMLTKKATINQALTAIRPDPSRLSSKFLLNYLNFRVEYWKSVASSSRKDPNITGRDVREFPIALPPLREQEAAGEALQDIEDQIFMLGELIAKKTEIKQAAMQELLTGKRRLPGFEGEWEEVQLGDIAAIRNAKTVATSMPAEAQCVELECIEQGSGRLLMTNHPTGQTTKYTFKEGDVLFGRLRAYLRKYWFASFDGVCTTEIWPLIARDERLSAGFLHLLVQTNDFIDAACVSYGTHMPRSDWAVLRKFQVKLPPRPEQDAIAAVIADIDAELSDLVQCSQKAACIKQGMMQQLLTGKIRLT